RAQNAKDLGKVFQAFSFMTGEVTSLDTLGGYITTRVLGIVPLMLALWAMIVGVGLIRGEEQQGTMEMLLSTQQSRAKVLRQKVSALLVAEIAVIGLTGLGLAGGTPATSESLDASAFLLTLLNILALVSFWGAVGLLAGQFVVARRKASGTVGGLI